jgi:molecular chaperone DnaK
LRSLARFRRRSTRPCSRPALTRSPNPQLATTSAALGGETLQNLLVSHLGSKFLKSTSLDVTADPMALQRLHDAAAQMVAELSNKTRADADLPYITADAGGPKHLLETVSRQVLEQMLDEAVGSLGLLKDTAFGTDAAAVVVNHLMDNLTAAKLTPADLGAVVLAGGASRAPAYAGAVRRAVNLLGGEDWGNKTLRVVEGELADELNVQGAALSLK